ncbi:DNA methylase [Dellaglioa algida]|nr:DNA methylase [Dellaglioa algida]
MDQGSLFEERNKPVECLGMTFQNNDERREYFRNELRKKLPGLKSIEGFPIGEDEDIIELSDPPYYTACPNPWIREISKKFKYFNSFDDNISEPLNIDISEGKTDPYYMMHSYHTKVPQKALIKYLLHYTKPEQQVCDLFSGSGMLGVATNSLNNKKRLEKLGFRVNGDNIYDENGYTGKLGERRAYLSDISPVAYHISKGLCNIENKTEFMSYFDQLISDIKNEYGMLFTTEVEGVQYPINYVVWTEIFECSNCSSEVNFWERAVKIEEKKVLDEFTCQKCGAKLTKRSTERVKDRKIDPVTKSVVVENKYEPVVISYKNGKKNFLKKLTLSDYEILKKTSELLENQKVPIQKIPDGDEIGRVKNYGLEYVHQLIPERSNIIISEVINRAKGTEFYNQVLFILTASINNLNKLYRWRINGKGGTTSGTYYIPSTYQENNPFLQFNRKVSDYLKLFETEDKNVYSSVSSATNSLIESNSIDYVFTDPPFGSNLMYSELSLIWETWLGVKTDNDKEAIVSKVQNKNLSTYESLMETSFREYYRILKPNHWITIEFSNSKANVWNALQNSMQKAGFIIANVSALDKQQGSFKAVTTTTAVKQDLVISAYKPLKENVIKTKEANGNEISAWLFLDQHLLKLPVFDDGQGEATVITERTPRILFDRMVAYHVQSGVPVPISSAEFQEKVAQKYVTRDGMIFLESQVTEYDKKRILVKEFSQQSLFVSDESSAIEWLRQQLMKKPQSRQDIHPQFMKEIQHIAKHEKLPELDNLLVENFLLYDGEDTIPAQVTAYLRKNYHDMRGLEIQDDRLKSKAKNRWYVPDPNKQADLEKLREKSLLREFSHYVEEVSETKKKLKFFRSEAIRAGFKKSWSEKEYQRIVEFSAHLPEKIIQEDDKLLMYYDNATIRLDI